MMLCIFDANKEEYADVKNPISTAIKKTAMLCGSTSMSVRKVLKEEALFGKLIGPPLILECDILPMKNLH